MSDIIDEHAGVQVSVFNGGVRGPCVQIDDGRDMVQMTERAFLDMVKIAAAKVRNRAENRRKR